MRDARGRSVMSASFGPAVQALPAFSGGVACVGREMPAELARAGARGRMTRVRENAGRRTKPNLGKPAGQAVWSHRLRAGSIMQNEAMAGSDVRLQQAGLGLR